MLRFIAKKVFYSLLVLIGVVMLVFLLFRVSEIHPGW